jgi:hypothetical protein
VHLQERRLDPLPGEGEHVVPLGTHRLFDVPRAAGVAPELQLRERTKTTYERLIPPSTKRWQRCNFYR